MGKVQSSRVSLICASWHRTVFVLKSAVKSAEIEPRYPVRPHEPQHHTGFQGAPVTEGFLDGQIHLRAMTCTGYQGLPVVKCTRYQGLTAQHFVANNCIIQVRAVNTCESTCSSEGSTDDAALLAR